MKIFKLLSLAIVLLSACQKETNDIGPVATAPMDINSHREAGKIKVTRPFKVAMYISVDTNSSIPPTACSGDLPGFANAGYFLHGHATCIGFLNADQSRGQDVTCDLSFTTALLTTSVAGHIAAADGDLIYYTGNDEINVFNLLTGAGPTGTITGLWTITGGTGKFEGATGSFPIAGPVDFATKTFSFTGEGAISY